MPGCFSKNDYELVSTSATIPRKLNNRSKLTSRYISTKILSTGPYHVLAYDVALNINQETNQLQVEGI